MVFRAVDSSELSMQLMDCRWFAQVNRITTCEFWQSLEASAVFAEMV
jgi:hypothetical protein